MHQQRAILLVVPLLLGVLVVPLLLLALVASQGTRPPNCPPPRQPAAARVSVTDLDTEQETVATQIVRAVRAFGPTTTKPHAAVIALATARQESGLRNLDYGDRDSLGAFQQRPSQGWGTPAEVRDVQHATTTFLQHLVQVPHWESLRVTEAAAIVQRPAEAYRGLYQQWVPLATSLTTRLWGSAASLVPVSAPGPPACDEIAAVAASTIGSVVYPVPAGLAGSNRDNWGGRGGHWSSWHTGTDFSVGCGTPVLAATAGTVVIDRTQSWAGRWLVKIVTSSTSVTTWYAHLRSVGVASGQRVRPGHQVGRVGDLGNATGCHLHFEVHMRNGPIYGPDNTDPTRWLASHVGRPLRASTTP